MFTSNQQSILQTVEGDPSTMLFLPLINAELEQMFGPTNSFFIKTTPRNLLFEGIEFCKDTIGIAKIICDIVKDRNSATIVPTEDGTGLKFSMFNHVNILNFNVIKHLLDV